MLVKTEAHLVEVCAALRAAGAFGLDTEFVQERNYSPRLGIVQVAAPGVEAILDPGAIGTLEPFTDLVFDATVEKVVHAGSGDFGIFYWRTGKAPKNVFDTQIAAAMLGFGDRISFQKLVDQVTGVKLAKSETLTDWTRRPLTPEQIDYALDDVRPLLPMRAKMGEKLAALGRDGWAREEFRALEDPAAYERPDPREVYQRIRASGLDGKAMAVLRELAAWREEAAAARDVPRGAVAKDEVLVEMARRPPTKQAALQGIRYLHPREIEQSGADMIAAVKRGLESPPLEPPPQVLKGEEGAPAAGLAGLLDCFLRIRANEAQISPSMLGTRAHLDAIAAARGAETQPDIPLLQGWRRELAGNDLLDLLAGKVKLSVDATTGAVRAERE